MLNLILRSSSVFFFLLFVGNSFGQINQTDANGLKQGTWVKKFEGKKEIKYKGKFKDGIPVGVFIFYYESGRVKAKNRYFNDGNDSFVSTYHENGKLMSMGKYVNKLKDSVWVYLDHYGNYISKDTYLAGMKHGKCITYYVYNPKIDVGPPNLLEVTMYKFGEKEGEAMKYYKNGKLLSKATYVLGSLEGKFITYYPTGKKKTVIHYKHGVRNGYTLNYDANEKLTSKQYYRQGFKLEGKKLEEYLERKKKRAREKKN
ncbi:MAG: toxin-antitoxin system YwqK family antitoxin [Flavobacteriales bacterium]